MVFRRASRLGTQIHSFKHVVDAEYTLTGGGKSVIPIADVVNARSAVTNSLENVVGETVNGVFLSIFIIGSTGAPVNASQNWYIAKARSGQNTTSDFPNPGETGASDVRNQIFHEEKGMVGSGDGTAMAFKGVVAIPKSMRRMREGDQFFIALRNLDATNDVNGCLKAIYKSFS